MELCSARPLWKLVLPELRPLNEPAFTIDEMKAIIVAAQEPYKTLYWICAEMGERSGEALALAVPNLPLEDAAIRIAQSVWHGKIQTVKSRKGNRIVEISPQLVNHLRDYLRTWKPNRLNLLFATNKGTPWDIDTVRKRRLHPLLDKLGIQRGLPCFQAWQRHHHGSIASTHGNPTKPLGAIGRSHHNGIHTRYSEDGRQFAAYLGQQLSA